MSAENHEQLVFWHDKVAGLKALIAIHDTTLGPAIGGVRLLRYDSEEDAISDALRLSKGMTYKASAVGVNFGGGQAVILAPSEGIDSDALWWSFGRFVQSLGGRFIAGEDVGTSVEDIERARQETKYVVGISHALGGGGDPGPITAHGVYSGLQACIESAFGDTAMSDLKVIIQGLGHVGYALARQLKMAGCRVYGIDINPVKTNAARTNLNIEIISPERVFDFEADIFAPCALGNNITAKTIDKLNFKIIGGSANNQLADDSLGQTLHDKGILYAPDFIIGAGGLINVCNEIEGYDQKRAVDQAGKIYDKIKKIIAISEETGVSMLDAAMVLARQRLDRIKRLRGLL
ncbi:MAG: Glu/Leu/Phe/Val dehydrogenase [candidate division Zixibacteria bacterium]|nr:Glu/Leu/Phe/Val dehydrogenase [candidate division Zixibacteria bacterium]